MLEAECTRCKEIFVPHGTEPEDLVHVERAEGRECGGLGIIQGQWLRPGEMEVREFSHLKMLEQHAESMPDCDDPDCEFHHPEVIEQGPDMYTIEDHSKCKIMQRPCYHQGWAGTHHCAEMTCSNYINKCPVHRLVP